MESDSPPSLSDPPPVKGLSLGRRRSRNHLLTELFIVTVGVLIALLLDGLLDWYHYRVLVRDARATIAREIADNKKELQGSLEGVDARNDRLENALRFANELIATQKTSVTELEIGFAFAELSAAAWDGAERTGAVAHMDYSEVQHYSKLYAMQRLYEDQRRRALGAVAAAMSGVATDDPTKAPIEDLKLFRQQLLVLRAELLIETQLAEQLVKSYDEPAVR